MPQWKDVLKNDLYEDRVIEVAVAKLKDMGGSNIRVGNTSLTAKFEFRDIANFPSHIEITWRRTLPLAKKSVATIVMRSPNTRGGRIGWINTMIMKNDADMQLISLEWLIKEGVPKMLKYFENPDTKDKRGSWILHAQHEAFKALGDEFTDRWGPV